MLTTETTTLYNLEKVFDGDSFLAVVDVGADTLRRVRIRVANVNTPETGEVGAREAKEFTTVWLNQPGIAVDLHRKPSGSYYMSFNRYVASVYVLSTGDTLAQALLQNEHAVVWRD